MQVLGYLDIITANDEQSILRHQVFDEIIHESLIVLPHHFFISEQILRLLLTYFIDDIEHFVFNGGLLSIEEPLITEHLDLLVYLFDPLIILNHID